MRKVIVTALTGLCFGLVLSAVRPCRTFAEDLGHHDLSHDVLAELNFARTHPAQYAEHLERGERPDDGGAAPDDSGWSAGEQDPDARDEAVAFLMRQRPLPPLREDPRLAAAAADHSSEQGRTGDVGHASESGEGLSERLHRHGLWAGMDAEDISYGYASPRQVVDQLIIDSGVAGRGHRQNIFDPTLQAAGVGCGRHSGYGAVCVIDFAGAIVER
jgi:uncharacterized protein YkwD